MTDQGIPAPTVGVPEPVISQEPPHEGTRMEPLLIILGFWAGAVVGAVAQELWITHRTKRRRDHITTNKFSQARRALGKDHRSS